MRYLGNKFKSAFNGIKEFTFSEKDNMVHVAAIVLVVTAGFVFKITPGEWIAIILCIGMVLTAEMINQNIERICNYIQPQQDEKIKKIKDMAAGAVLIASIIAVIVALIIFVPEIILSGG